MQQQYHFTNNSRVKSCSRVRFADGLDFSGVRKTVQRPASKEGFDFEFLKDLFFNPVSFSVLFCITLFAVVAGSISLSNSSIATMFDGSIEQPALNTSSLQLTADGKIKKEELWKLVKHVGKEQNVSPELLWAVITVESRFNHRARSKKGAQGLMQLMPKTAKTMAVKNPYDPYQNVRGGAKYLSYLLERYDGKKEIALAAYNAGPGAVERHGGIPPYKETKHYVAQVMGLYKNKGARSS